MQQGQSSPVDLRQLHAPTTVVRFAIESNLDAYASRVEGRTVRGRQELARALSLGAPGLTERLKSRAGLAKLAREVEDLGFAERGTVSRLAGQVALLRTDVWSIGGSWWPTLRDGYRLHDVPNFDRAFEVLLAAEAFAAAHPLLLQKPPNKPDSSNQITEQNLSACRVLIEQLCWLASGPFGVAYDSQRLIAYLAPVSPETVTNFIRSGVITTQVIRALDRSLRLCTWNSVMREQYTDLLASPPPKIYRRTNWMRALRRLRLLDFVDTNRPEVPKREWLINKLLFALKGELSYSGARATDRRYAFWCLAELERDATVWSSVRAIAELDPAVAPLLTASEQLRQTISRVGLARTDAFQFIPPGGWAMLQDNQLWSNLLDEVGPEGLKSMSELWQWAKPRTKSMAIAMMQEALFNPDVIRQRSSTDALGAAGAEMRDSVSATVGHFLTSLLARRDSPLYLIERSLAVLGMMGRVSSKDVIQASLRQLHDECLVQAVASAGDIAYRHPAEAPWLIATVIEVVRQRLQDEDVVIAGIAAMVAVGRAPLRAVPELETLPSQAVQATLQWADKVEFDRARLSQTSQADSYPTTHQP